MKKLFLFVACVLCTLIGNAEKFPSQNPGLTPAGRAKDLLPRLTLEEKALLMCDESEAIPPLGIKRFNWWSEALHGVANQGNVTVFSEPVGMATSFHDQLAFDIFTAASDAMHAAAKVRWPAQMWSVDMVMFTKNCLRRQYRWYALMPKALSLSIVFGRQSMSLMKMATSMPTMTVCPASLLSCI